MTNANLTYIASKINDTLATSGYPDPATLAQLKTDLEFLLQSLQTNPPTISAVSADFSTLLIQLQEHIRKNDTWKDLHVSSTGRIILDLIAAIGAFLQNSIHVAFKEGFIHTANRDSSVYAATRMLGAKINRKSPAKTKVWLNRTTTSSVLTVPEYTQFVVGGMEYFNADPIIFPSGESIIPINIGFEDGVAVRKDSLVAQVYTADVVFPDTGKLFFPCTGTITCTIGTTVYTGTVQIISDSTAPNSAFGSIVFTDSFIAPYDAVFDIEMIQYNGSLVKGHLVPKSASSFLRFPASLALQFKRTGVGSSILTPALGTANIPQTAVVLTNEDYAVVKNKYLLPQYLDKSVVIYDNDIFLYSGRIATVEHTVANTSEFYSISLNQPGFNVSNDHIYIEVFDGTNITVWTKAVKPIWDYSADSTVFFESTLGNGDCIITFGNGVHGKRVESNWVIGVRFVLTKGAVSNSVAVGLDVSCSSYAVAGATLTPAYGGADEKSSEYYKFTAPIAFKSKRRATTKEDHEGIFLDFPNVADVAVLGQKDIAPYDIRFMNRLSVALLPVSPQLTVYPTNSLMAGSLFDASITNPKDPNEPNRYMFTDLELQDFQYRFKSSAWSGFDVDLFKSPIPKPIYVKIRAFIYRQYSLDLVSAKLNTAIKELFRRRPGILGRSFLHGDLIDACKSITEVDYIEVLEPTFDVILGDNVADRCTFVCLAEAPTIMPEYTARRSYDV
jgi:hypothetical protein